MRHLPVVLAAFVALSARAEAPAGSGSTPAPEPAPMLGHAITVAPSTLLGLARLRYDHVLNGANGIAVDFWYLQSNITPANTGLADTTILTNNIEGAVSYVWYGGKTPLEGSWLSAGVSAGKLDETTDLDGALTMTKGTVIGPRIQAGYNWVWTSGLLVGVHLGVAYNYFRGTATSSKPQVRTATADGLDFNGLFLVGYAW